MSKRLSLQIAAMLAVHEVAWGNMTGLTGRSYYPHPSSPGKKPTGAAAAKRMAKKRRNKS